MSEFNGCSTRSGTEADSHKARASRWAFGGRESGFTLVELMIVVGVVAILAAIALPSYTDYILRGRVTEATNALSAMGARMEQYYQDNRTYAVTGGFTPPCLTAATAGMFSVSCTGANGVHSAVAYTIAAYGSGTMSAFVYTIDQSGTKATVSTKWGGTSASCWLMKSNDSC